MIKNALKIALRNFRRQPGYTILNILGLTVGIAATLFILLYITEENRFDKYHEKADRIYRISSDVTEPDDAFRWAVTQSPLGMQLKQDYPEVEEYVRFISNGRTRFQRGETDQNYFFEEKVYLVDSTVCDVFSFNFLLGDAKSALREPNSIALSNGTSKRIFGNDNPLGEFLQTPSGRKYKVTGVYEDMPKYSHLIANAMISSNTIPGLGNPDADSWSNFGIYTYVLLKEGTSVEAFAAKLPEVINKYVAVIFDELDIKIKYEAIGLTDIHLHSTFEGEPEPTGEIGFLYIFGIVGLFLLLIACINYMNLATARATKRATEVGIRKVLGSERRQLIWLFLGESIIFTTIALVLSFLLVLILLPVFNNAFELTLGQSLLVSGPVLIGALGILLLAGIVGGSYPAFYLSAFPPISVLKGNLSKGTGNPGLRKALVTLQFAITIFMLIGTGIIYDQMQYLRTKDLGFNKEHVLTFELAGRDGPDKYPILREKLLQNPKITSIGTATTTPGDGYGKVIMTLEKADGTTDQYGVDNYGVDYEFFPTMGIEVVEGRNFSREFGSDTSLAVMVNQAMVKRMNWSDAIGRKVKFGNNDTIPFMKIVGVVKDFHQSSLYDPITPILFFPRFNNRQIHVRMNPQGAEDVSAILGYAKQQWQEVFPGEDFEYGFVDASFMELYQADQIRARLFTLFSVLMIFVACLGLLGLTSFTAEQRTKEIGVRKIMGANTTDIVYLLTRNFILLVGFAALPAFIAAWYFMTKWLETFSYHTTMNYWMYALAFFLVGVITLLTTSYYAIRAAYGNPVEALRYE
ncbi:MAG: ABC transporter permease [Saprospiraceae bacterium]|nr:MAG: ABC transporter permease [Saprospiraceae bacterium]